jgi:exo-beta-1,3-glucanase (GH17 family)
MHDLGDHGQGAHGRRSRSRTEQWVGEVGWPTIGRRSQIAVEPSRVNVAGANIVMPWQIQMRQIQIRLNDLE